MLPGSVNNEENMLMYTVTGNGRVGDVAKP